LILLPLTEPLQMDRWIAHAVMSNLLDICLSIIPALIVHDLQMSTSTKLKIVSLFAIRLT
jgi:heme/copper-type cytochrome/quinol oxidase subunit 4